MMDWAMLGVDYLGEPGSLPARLPLERKVRLAGLGGEAALVLRGSQGLGHELARGLKRGAASSQEEAGAAMSELALLLAEAWRKRGAAGAAAQGLVFLSELSSPDSWPSGPPDACIVATAKGWGMELLLWSPPEPGGEAPPWGMPAT